jgi:murein DD-endopeptidase MepM/ murein hydrolase activator NlpD
MNMKPILFCITLLISAISIAQTDFSDNESGLYEDMLTPEYYSSDVAEFRSEVKKFLYYARQIRFYHPLEVSEGLIPSVSTPFIGQFGAGKGPTGTEQHHPAVDMHVGDDEVNLSIYAAFDGYISTFKDAAKYRDFISLTTEVKDENNNVLGKIRVIYAHVDLLLDESENIALEGKFVQKGELISKHLYAGTVGGPHLHFEIRYYRPGEQANEDFYGSIFPGVPTEFTEPSSGSWDYGFWNPDVGYGFAHPENHLGTLNSSLKIKKEENILIYSNPVEKFINVLNSNSGKDLDWCLFSMERELLEQNFIKANQTAVFDWSKYEKGIYLIQLSDINGLNARVIKIIKI